MPTTADQMVGGDTADGWDVDVFWCEGDGTPASYAAARLAATKTVGLPIDGRTLAPGVRLGRVRLRVLSAERQASGLFFRSGSNYVVEDGPPKEAQAAKTLAAGLSRGGAAYEVKTNVATKTKWTSARSLAGEAVGGAAGPRHAVDTAPETRMPYNPPAATRRKAFVSYHHRNDQFHDDEFSRVFHDRYELITDTSLERRIDSADVNYAMRRIREHHLS